MVLIPNKIREVILSSLPTEAQVTRIEFEGPEISIYVKKPEVMMENENLTRNIAKAIKKRVVVRTDPSIRRSKDEATRIIKELTPAEADIRSIEFDDTLGEVIIKAKKPGLVIGKGGSLLKTVLIKTGWRPVVVRAPPIESKILPQVIQHLIDQSEYRLNVLRNVGYRIHRPPIFKINHVRITFLGGAKEVGRSAILVETAESKILLDAGINPGAIHPIDAYPRVDLDQFKLEDLDAVVISHAHLDHCGFLPFLFKYGYEGPIYTTRATRDLMALLQLDYIEIAAKEGKELPYGKREVRKMVLHTIPLEYGEVTDISPDVRVTLYNAGHILGSAMVHLHIGEGLHNIVYTSDFKFGPTKLLEKANYKFPRIETLIMESTYGIDELPPRDEAERQLISTVKETIERKGKVLIPVLSVGRAQEIMLILIDAITAGQLPEIPIYLEGMIDEVTAIHTAYPELLSNGLRERIYRGENPFTADCVHIVEDREARREIVDSPEPSIVMATSGMLTGGPAVDYLKMLAPDPRNTLIFVSYQVEGTLGRKIKDGIREIPFITPEGKVDILKINMRVEAIEGFSGHSDRRQLIAFLQNVKPRPKTIILNHGEYSKVHALAKTIKSISEKRNLGFEVYTPSVMDSIRLV